MSKIDDNCRKVIERAEWFAIVTEGPDGPHLAACWGQTMRSLGYEDGVLRIPAWGYRRTEENLRRNSRVQLLFASREVARAQGQGQGCVLIGQGELQTSGPDADRVKAQFPGTRGALIVKIQSAQTQL